MLKLNRVYSLLVWLSFIVVFTGCKQAEQEPQQEVKYPIAKVSTRLGDMYFWMYDATPNHKAKFIELAEAKHYNQFTFNRVIRHFVIQGGCPDSVKYFENSPFLIDPEFVDTIGHHYGALGMGRDDNPKKQSNACQFYVVNKEQGLPNLDGDYMIFGTIIKGTDLLESIEKVLTDATSTPKEDIPLDVSIVQYSEEALLAEFGLRL